jgi:hypothetical protein
MNNDRYFDWNGPTGEGYYPGSDPVPHHDGCWEGMAREDPVPANQVRGTVLIVNDMGRP